MKSLKRKQVDSPALQHMAKVTASVQELLKNEVIRIIGNTIYLHPELWYNKKTAIAWVKNMYMYCRLTDKISPDQPLYFKHIETDQVLGFYQDKEPSILIEC